MQSRRRSRPRKARSRDLQQSMLLPQGRDRAKRGPRCRTGATTKAGADKPASETDRLEPRVGPTPGRGHDGPQESDASRGTSLPGSVALDTRLDAPKGCKPIARARSSRYGERRRRAVPTARSPARWAPTLVRVDRVRQQAPRPSGALGRLDIATPRGRFWAADVTHGQPSISALPSCTRTADARVALA
jgi:hypothetical protein